MPATMFVEFFAVAAVFAPVIAGIGWFILAVCKN